MLTSSFLGFKYARIIRPQINFQELEKLKKNFSYLYLVSYEKQKLNGWQRLDKLTPLIKLNTKIDKIFSRFHASTRNHVNKTFKNKKLTFKILDNNHKTFYKLHRQLERTQNRTPLPYKEFKQYQLFTAYYNDQAISAMACYTDHKIIRTGLIFSARLQKLNLKTLNKNIIGYASKRIIYEICKYGIENNLNAVDLAIINFDDPTKAGIARFKNSFGGEIVDTYLYRYIHPLFYPIRKFFRDLKIINIH